MNKIVWKSMTHWTKFFDNRSIRYICIRNIYNGTYCYMSRLRTSVAMTPVCIEVFRQIRSCSCSMYFSRCSVKVFWQAYWCILIILFIQQQITDMNENTLRIKSCIKNNLNSAFVIMLIVLQKIRLTKTSNLYSMIKGLSKTI